MSGRFEVRTEGTQYRVVDTTNEQGVKFSFSCPPVYGEQLWGNWHAALGFAQRLDAKQKETSK